MPLRAKKNALSAWKKKTDLVDLRHPLIYTGNPEDNMAKFISYTQERQPKVGDVVCMASDHSAPAFSPFSTSIVEDVRPHPQYPEVIEVHLVRPHCRAEKIGSMRGTVFTGHERYPVPLDMFIERYQMYSTGSMPDNRGKVI